MKFWDPVGIEREQTLYWKIGVLSLWIRRCGSELWIYSEESGEETSELICAGAEPAPEEATWHRWSVAGMGDFLQLKPAMPDRPVVVRPEKALSFCKGVEEVFYARIPFWVSVLIGGETPDALLCRIPTVTLSNTWFGLDTTKGEICYGMQSSARQSLEGVDPVVHRMICPVRMANTSDDFFDVKRLCIHTRHLNIYHFRGQLWTSRQDITFRGEGKKDQLRFNDDWFGEDDEGVELVSECSSPVETKLFKRSMQGLKSLVNFA